MIERRWDEDAEILVATATGKWTVAAVAEHYAALREFLEERRKQGKPTRILSDVSRAQRQDAETERCILIEMARTYAPGDRVAILTGGADDQLYVRSQMAGVQVAVFSSRIPAEMWLVTDSLA